MNTIGNERLKVTFRYSPGEAPYHRFETMGVMEEVVLDGKDVFTEPEQREAGRRTCYGTGLCGEYVWNELGAGTAKGEWYPKFGVGLIRQNQDGKPYDMWDASYDYTLFPVRAEFLGDRAVFVQEPVPCQGYAARIVKEISLVGNEIHSVTTVENCGEKPLDMAEYQHNFVAMNHEAIGPEYELEIPFCRELARIEGSVFAMETREKTPDALAVTGGMVHWNRSMGEGLTLSHVFEKEALDCGGPSFWRLRNKKQGLSLTEEFDFAPSRLVMWGIEHCICTEAYAPIQAAPGERCRFTRTWRFERERGE